MQNPGAMGTLGVFYEFESIHFRSGFSSSRSTAPSWEMGDGEQDGLQEATRLGAHCPS